MMFSPDPSALAGTTNCKARLIVVCEPGSKPRCHRHCIYRLSIWPWTKTLLSVPLTPLHTYIPSAPGFLGDLLTSLQRPFIVLNASTSPRSTRWLKRTFKSVGRVLDHIERLDLDSLSTNANALLVEVRHGSNAKVQTFIDDTDGTVKKMQLEKLTNGREHAGGTIAGDDCQTGTRVDQH